MVMANFWAAVFDPSHEAAIGLSIGDLKRFDFD
jgi:hypothetical protein